MPRLSTTITPCCLIDARCLSICTREVVRMLALIFQPTTCMVQDAAFSRAVPGVQVLHMRIKTNKTTGEPEMLPDILDVSKDWPNIEQSKVRRKQSQATVLVGASVLCFACGFSILHPN